jgi:AcrR family transcriptional regulator
MPLKVAHHGREFLDVGVLLSNTWTKGTHLARKVDRRTERTRAALLSAFVELVLSRGYDAVRVADIIRRANVGRSTFYLHYAGKDALLKESLAGPCSTLAACARDNATARMLMPLLEHFREQRNLNRALFEHPVRSVWVKRLAALIERNLAPTSSAARRPLLPRSLLALTVAEMQIGLITHWLNAAPSLKSDLIAEALFLNTRAILARPA